MLVLQLFRELLPFLFLGYLIGRFKPELSSQISRPLIRFGLPISLMGLLLKSGLDWNLLKAIGMALFGIGLLIALIRIIPKLRSLIGSKSLLLGSAFGNSGYFGIPVSLSLLPQQALNFSIGYDLGATLLVWSLGPILLTKSTNELSEEKTWRDLLNAFAGSPAIKGLIGALIIQSTPWRDQITSALWMPAKLVILLALLIVGIRLSYLGSAINPTNKNLRSIITPSLFTKLVFLPALMLILCTTFGLPVLMRNALVLQAATPTAISVLLLAEASRQDQEVATALVAWSTLISIFTIPIWFLVLQ